MTINVQHIEKTFGKEPNIFRAIDDLSFSIDAGEFVGYAGPNGAGKSTSIKAMIGLLAVTSGSIRVLGMDPLQKRQRLAQDIGIVFGQRSQLLWELAPQVTFNLIRSMYRLDKTTWKKRLDELIEALSLAPFINQPVRSLSLGQRMRCELTAALLHNPKILFLDEPTVGLDLEARQAIRHTLTQMNVEHKTTIILTTHDLQDIEALCSRLIIINHGKLAYDGTIERLYAEHAEMASVCFVLRASESDRHVEDIASNESEQEVTIHLDDLAASDVLSDTSAKHLTVSFDKQQYSAADVIRKVLDQRDIIDLRIIEPKIDDVIGSIYRQKHTPSA